MRREAHDVQTWVVIKRMVPYEIVHVTVVDIGIIVSYRELQAASEQDQRDKHLQHKTVEPAVLLWLPTSYFKAAPEDERDR